MALVFDATDYKNVRALIDVSLSADQLPDATIALDSFQGEAAAVVEDELSSLTDEQRTAQAAAIKRAAVRLIASYIAPKVPILTSETLEGDRFTFEKKDFAKIAADLERQAFEALARILKLFSETPDTPNTAFAAGLFTTARARRK